jgi:hypothetical protein
MIPDISKHYNAFIKQLYPVAEGTTTTHNSGNYNRNNIAKRPRKRASYLPFLCNRWPLQIKAGILI